jgi:echinoid
MYDIFTDESENTGGVGTVQSTLRFTGKSRPGGNQIVPSDRGQYSCVFYNSVKQAETSMLLRIERKWILNKIYFK